MEFSCKCFNVNSIQKQYGYRLRTKNHIQSSVDRMALVFVKLLRTMQRFISAVVIAGCPSEKCTAEIACTLTLDGLKLHSY